MIKYLKDLHGSYSQALRRGADIGKKELINAWRNSDNVITSGQYFERKVLPNGNIKTRIATIYDNSSKAIGLETKVMTPEGELVYNSAGVVKDNSVRLMGKIRRLQQKVAKGLDTSIDNLRLRKLKQQAEQNTKLYKFGEKTKIARELMYYSTALKDPKTLVGQTYGKFWN